MALRRRPDEVEPDSDCASVADLLLSGRIERLPRDAPASPIWSYEPWIELGHPVDVKKLYEQDDVID